MASSEALPASVPALEDLCGGEDDAVSLNSTCLSGISAGKARKLRRQRVQQKHDAAVAAGSAQESSCASPAVADELLTLKDAAVQCTIDSEKGGQATAFDLEKRVELLESQLASQKLKTLTWKGKFHSLRRLVGDGSDWDDSHDDDPGECDDSGDELHIPNDEATVGDSVVIHSLASVSGL